MAGYAIDSEDWTCEEGFTPAQSECPSFEVASQLGEMLEIASTAVKELARKLSEMLLFKIKRIVAGLLTAELTTIKVAQSTC